MIKNINIADLVVGVVALAIVATFIITKIRNRKKPHCGGCTGCGMNKDISDCQKQQTID